MTQMTPILGMITLICSVSLVLIINHFVVKHRRRTAIKNLFEDFLQKSENVCAWYNYHKNREWRKYSSHELDHPLCLIIGSFKWGRSKEGVDYWFTLSKKWIEVLNIYLEKHK